MPGKVRDGVRLVIRRPKGTPDVHILSPDQQRLLFVLERKGITQDHGMDRRWNNLLRAGDSVYQAGVPHLVKIVRVVEEEAMQLYGADGALLTELIRVVRGRGYSWPDVKHTFSLQGRTYLLDTQTVFTGTNISCTDQQSGQPVFHFATSLFKKGQSGQLHINEEVPKEQLNVMLCAFLAYWEYLERRSLLIFGDRRYNQNMVP